MRFGANYINIMNFNNGTQLRYTVRIHIPREIRELLGNPIGMCIREHPLRLIIPSMSTNKITKFVHKSKCILIYTPLAPVDELIGKYSYELDDMTLYLEKIIE